MTRNVDNVIGKLKSFDRDGFREKVWTPVRDHVHDKVWAPVWTTTWQVKTQASEQAKMEVKKQSS